MPPSERTSPGVKNPAPWPSVFALISSTLGMERPSLETAKTDRRYPTFFNLAVPRETVEMEGWFLISSKTFPDTITPPGEANASILAATFTPSPYTPSTSRAMSPVCTPMRRGIKGSRATSF